MGRGPFHLLSLAVAVSVSLCLPAVYVIAVEALGIFLGYGYFYTIRDFAVSDGTSAYVTGARFAGLILASAWWAVMMRPLTSAPRRAPAAMQVTAATQPDLFDLISILCQAMRIPVPKEVWLDCGTEVRVSRREGIGAFFKNRVTLTVGMALLGVLKARELAALLAMELAKTAGGPGLMITHAMRETQLWMFRAHYRRDPWERPLPPAENPDDGPMMRWARGLWRNFSWLAQRPFWLCMMLTRASASVARLGMEANARECSVRLIGHEATGRAQQKKQLLADAWRLSLADVEAGLELSRLPENLTLLAARHFSAVSARVPPFQLRWRIGTTRRPPAADLVEYLGPALDAAVLVQDFVDISRQVSWFYYQHEMGIALHQHRMVAPEESLHQKRRESQGLAAIRRYFHGLAHPERALCGLTRSHAANPGLAVLKGEVIAERQWSKRAAHQLRASLREWNLAWQRRRDLEAACALSLAGFTVSRVQYGTEDSSPASFLRDAMEQKTLMENLDDPLRHAEAHLEKRLTSALALLWWSPSDSLPDGLAEMRQQLPAMMGVYEALGSVLPSFRELLTAFHSYQTLGAKYAWAPATGSLVAVLQSLQRPMNERAAQILRALDGAACPFAGEAGRAISLAEFLAPPRRTEESAPRGSALEVQTHGLQDTARRLVTDTSEQLAPFVDQFLALYHHSFGWLAEAAERTERFVFGGADLDAPSIEEGDEILSILEAASVPEETPRLAPAARSRKLAVA